MFILLLPFALRPWSVCGLVSLLSPHLQSSHVYFEYSSSMLVCPYSHTLTEHTHIAAHLCPKTMLLPEWASSSCATLVKSAHGQRMLPGPGWPRIPPWKYSQLLLTLNRYHLTHSGFQSSLCFELPAIPFFRSWIQIKFQLFPVHETFLFLDFQCPFQSLLGTSVIICAISQIDTARRMTCLILSRVLLF